MGTWNGGLYDYNNRVSKNIFGHRDEYKTKTVTIKSGQVIKALSFLQSIATGSDKGKMQTHSAQSEAALVTFAAITAGQTQILAGLTFTAGSGGTSAAKLAIIWGNLAAGVGFVAANVIIAAEGIDTTVDGSFTAGTLTGYETALVDADTVEFTSTAGLSNVADLTATGTATAPIISIAQGQTTFLPPAGVTMYDIDASAGDVEAEVFVEADFKSESLVWAVDPATDTIEKSDGTLLAVTAYNTGTLASDFFTTRRLQSQFVENTGFQHLTFTKAGEIYNG
jgi:hypothetical protein